ncbi:MAG: hypothetical protein KGL39_04275 [Patescibacteria group bacterium]|nr:hypothetical protein [Patescibacteria group bacterium]
MPDFEHEVRMAEMEAEIEVIDRLLEKRRQLKMSERPEGLPQLKVIDGGAG